MSYIDPARAKAFEAALDMKRLGTNRYDVLEDARRIEAYLTDREVPADQPEVSAKTGETMGGEWWKAHQAVANPAVADDERSPVPSGEVKDDLHEQIIAEVEERYTGKPERKPRKAKKAATGKKRGRPSKADKEAAVKATEPIANGAAEHIAPSVEASPIPDQIAA